MTPARAWPHYPIVLYRWGLSRWLPRLFRYEHKYDPGYELALGPLNLTSIRSATIVWVTNFCRSLNGDLHLPFRLRLTFSLWREHPRPRKAPIFDARPASSKPD